jgi:hypothetical protein
MMSGDSAVRRVGFCPLELLEAHGLESTLPAHSSRSTPHLSALAAMPNAT